MAFNVEGEARFSFTNVPGVVPIPPDNGELKVQQADGILFTRRQDGSVRQTPLENIAVRGHTPVPDANYQALVTDVQIGFVVLTAARTVFLPDVDAYPLGQVLFIADESGQCSTTNIITIAPGAGTGDTIAGSAAGLTLQEPYLGIGFRRGAANVWIIAR